MPGDLNNPPPGGADELERLRAFLAERGLSEGFVKNNVRVDRYDTRLFADVLKAEPELESLVSRAGKDAPRTFGVLLLDLFASFYKMVPELVEEHSVDPSHLRANRPLIERLREDEETLLARLDTATDEVASALATTSAARRILKELARRPALREWMESQAQPRPEDPASPSEEAAAADESIEPPAPPPGTGDQPSAEPPAKGVGPQVEVPGGFAGDLRALVRAASLAGSCEAAAHAATLRDWGLRPADLRTVPIEERLEIASTLRTRRMRELADLLGRMRNHRRASERRKVKANRDEIHAVETSGDIARVLPSEIAGAFGSRNAHRKRDFYRRLSERSLLSYSLRTEEPAGRGPVIALIDSSYSMNGPPMEWASAVALALAHAASGAASGGASGKAGSSARRVHAIFFNAGIVLEVELAPGEKDVRKYLQVGTVDAGGGTDYVPPLARALEIVASTPKTDEGTPDLLLVTDGVCELPGEFAAHLREEKSARGFKLVSVLVGENARAASLEPFSDRILRAEDLARASGARDAAGELFDSL